MDPEAVARSFWIIGGIVAAFVIGGIVFAIVYRLRGPSESKVLATNIVGLGEVFDWTVTAPTGGRHRLWLKFGVEAEGDDSLAVAFRLRMRIDDAPEKIYLYNCDGGPEDPGMQGAWLARSRFAGGSGTLSATTMACGFKPRPPGTPIRMRGVIVGEPNVKSGGFEMRFSRK